MGLFKGGGNQGNNSKGPDLAKKPAGQKNLNCAYNCINGKRRTWDINPATDQYDWIWVDCGH